MSLKVKQNTITLSVQQGHNCHWKMTSFFTTDYITKPYYLEQTYSTNMKEIKSH